MLNSTFVFDDVTTGTSGGKMCNLLFERISSLSASPQKNTTLGLNIDVHKQQR